MTRPPDDRPSADRQSDDRPPDDRPSADRPPDDRPSDDRPSADRQSADRPPEAAVFADLGLRPELLHAVTALGYEEPTPIQREAIPPLLEGRDLLGQAATGTGKTAAFALPILQRMGPGERAAEPMALVLVPTRELAIQVSEAVHRYGRQLGARVLPIYGGQPIARQLRALDRGIDVVVATPGRALDHIRRRTLRLESLRVVVLDEADEMLDMGFADDIEAILDESPPERQTMLFSATMPPRIDGMARRHLRDPLRIVLGRDTVSSGEAPLVRQSAYIVPRAHKPAALGRVLDVEAPASAIVFCRTREEVDQLTETLNGRGYRAEALHGGMSQEQRERVMGRLRSGTADLLVATDVAARGLDIDQLTHVINYNVPAAPDAYVHRIGRVGRAGREGAAITLAEPREHRMLKTIERVTRQRIAIEKVPTVADLRARRLELTRAALHESLLGDDLDHFRVVVETLTDEFDVMEVALAAVKLAHEAGGAPADDQEIPEIPAAKVREDREQPRRAFAGSGAGGGKGTSHGAPKGAGYGSGKGPPHGAPEGPGHGAGHGAGKGRGRLPAGDMTRLWVGAGRAAGIRPGDLVGAIANESGLSGRDIGAIEITERFSLVEVPDAAADRVIAALRDSTIKGKRATVRRDRDKSR